MSFSRYWFSLIKACKEAVCIYNRLWVNRVKDDKTLRLNVLALNAFVLDSCAICVGKVTYKISPWKYAYDGAHYPLHADKLFYV